MEQQQIHNQLQSITKAYNEFNALKMRLDTSPLLEKVELFLRGAAFTVQQNETGEIKTIRTSIGVPKMNDDGIQTILNWLSTTVNPQTVQGNYYVDNAGFSFKYEQYIEEYHIELSTLIILNAYNWDVPDNETDGIIKVILLLIQPYMTRLLENKERDSYSQTMKTIESNTLSGKGFNFMGEK